MFIGLFADFIKTKESKDIYNRHIQLVHIKIQKKSILKRLRELDDELNKMTYSVKDKPITNEGYKSVNIYV